MKLIKTILCLSFISLLMSCSSIFEGREGNISLDLTEAISHCDRSVFRAAKSSDNSVYVTAILSGDFPEEISKTISIPVSELEKAKSTSAKITIKFDDLPENLAVIPYIRIDDSISKDTETPLYDGECDWVYTCKNSKPVTVELTKSPDMNIVFVDQSNFETELGFLKGSEPASTTKRLYLKEDVSLTDSISVTIYGSAYIFLDGHTIKAPAGKELIKYGTTPVDSDIHFFDGTFTSGSNTAYEDKHFICQYCGKLDLTNITIKDVNIGSNSNLIYINGTDSSSANDAFTNCTIKNISSTVNEKLIKGFYCTLILDNTLIDTRNTPCVPLYAGSDNANSGSFYLINNTKILGCEIEDSQIDAGCIEAQQCALYLIGSSVSCKLSEAPAIKDNNSDGQGTSYYFASDYSTSGQPEYHYSTDTVIANNSANGLAMSMLHSKIYFDTNAKTTGKTLVYPNGTNSNFTLLKKLNDKNHIFTTLVFENGTTSVAEFYRHRSASTAYELSDPEASRLPIDESSRTQYKYESANTGGELYYKIVNVN